MAWYETKAWYVTRQRKHTPQPENIVTRDGNSRPIAIDLHTSPEGKLDLAIHHVYDWHSIYIDQRLARILKPMIDVVLKQETCND